MKVRIPKTIKIATHTYRIELRSGVTTEMGSAGLVDHIKKVIFIDKNLSQSEIDEGFLHEVLHVIERVWNIKIDDPDTDRYAEGLAVFLKDNLGIEFDWSE